MAGVTPRDPPHDCSDGRIERQQDPGIERDQTSADSDPLAADRDHASDRDVEESGITSRPHDSSRDVRRRTARQREHSAQARMDAAEQRDAIAETRDVAARARDQAADARDLALAQRDSDARHDDGARAVGAAEIVIRTAGQRKRTERQRTQVAEQRALAAEDRRVAARDRERGALERRRALVDREMFARQLAIVETDALTGARTLAAGLNDLDHELDHCRRASGLLVVAYVDVVGLKALDDGRGNGGGDVLLRRVVDAIRGQLRSYDLIVRLGGDEFLCVMSDMTLLDARERFSQVAAALAGAPDGAAITAGFAELAPDETATQLIARADSELIDNRHSNY